MAFWIPLGALFIATHFRAVLGFDKENLLSHGVSFAIVMAIISYLTFFAAMLGFVSSFVVLLAIALVIFVFIKKQNPLNRWQIDILISKRLKRYNPLLNIIYGIFFLLCGSFVVGWDAAVHHYAFPKIIAANGILTDVPEIPFSYYPSLVEMHYLLDFGFSSTFPGIFSFVFLILLVIGFLDIGDSADSPLSGIWAIFIFFGSAMVFEIPFAGMVDLQFTVYCLLALAVLLHDKIPFNWKKYILIGILIGCACATKHLGLLYLLAFAPIFIWKAVSSKISFGKSVGYMAVIALVALIVPLPWYIRSYAHTGDPLFPFLSNLVHLAGAQQGSFSVESFARTDYPRNIFTFFYYLVDITMHYRPLRPWYWAINPAFLAFLPPAIILGFRSKNTNIKILLVLAFVSSLINFFLAPAFPRYMYPTWMCLSITSAWVLEYFYNRYKPVSKYLVPIALFLPFMIVMGMAAKRVVDTVPTWFSEEKKIEALTDAFPGYPVYQYANVNLSKDDRILTTDPKIYYIDIPSIIGTPGIESTLIVPWDSEPDEILDNWKELGVTHFILDTTLTSIKHGFGIDYFGAVIGDREKVWLNIVSTRAGANAYGIGDIMTDQEFLEMSALGRLPIVNDGTIDQHLFTQDSLEKFRTYGRTYKMANTIHKFIEAGFLKEEFRSGPGGGIRLYSVHIPENYTLPPLPDVTFYCLDYEDGPD
jgi:hypothetical protein